MGVCVGQEEYSAQERLKRMKCAYCGKEAKGTKEHIISCAILDLFPECYLTFDDSRDKIYANDPVVKDACAECNNQRILFDGLESEDVTAEKSYVLIQNTLLQYAANDMKSHK